MTREEGTKGDVLVQECSEDCPICPKDFETPLVIAPPSPEAQEGQDTPLVHFGDLERDGFVVVDSKVDKLISYEQLAKVKAPIAASNNSKGKKVGAKNGWSIIFNTEDSQLLGGPSQTKNASGASRRQMDMDPTTNSVTFKKVPEFSTYRFLADQVAADFGKVIGGADKPISLNVMNPVLLHTELGCVEQDAHRDWKRNACIGLELTGGPLGPLD